MAIKINQLVPAVAIHPGEILREELENRNIKQKDFSELTGIQPSQLNEILSGKRGINADLALIIGAALKMEGKIWLNLQSNYELDLAKIRNKTEARVKSIEEWQKYQPYIGEGFLKKLGYLASDPSENISIIKKLFRIKNPEELVFPDKELALVRLRKSEKLDVDMLNLNTWINLINFESSKIDVAAFDLRKMESLVEELKEVFWKNKNTIVRIKEILFSYGIKLVIVDHPQKCAVDGLAFWSNSNPVIGLSLRFKRIDYLAFTLFHELGHVFLHIVNRKNDKFLDVNTENVKHTQSKEEEDADTFSRDNLISPESWADYLSLTTRMLEISMLKFARREKIHPAIIKGRLSHELKNYRIKTKFDSEIK